ncbi:MAG TPA: heme-binding protein [Pseudolabrys sp.]|nr:heme-binding protein [Pseudolabrys sp.]
MKVRYQLYALATLSIAASPAAAQVVTEKQVSAAVAQEIAQAAMMQCRNDGYHVAVTVVDRSGQIKAVLRDDGGNPHLLEASQRKAYTSAMFRAPSGAFAERVQQNSGSAALTELNNVIALRGGLPIKVGDEVIGAVGVGGAPGGDKDEACAQAGIQKAADKLR